MNRTLRATAALNSAMITYTDLVRHIVPGPRSISWFIPLIVLPVALVIPRTVLSRWQSIGIFMPVVTISVLHAWMIMGTVDVITSNALLWSFFLLAVKDPWREFRWVEGKDVQGDMGSAGLKTDVGGAENPEGEEEEESSAIIHRRPLLPTVYHSRASSTSCSTAIRGRRRKGVFLGKKKTRGKSLDLPTPC